MKIGYTTMKKIIAALIFAFVSSSVFAVEEYVSMIYKQIDTAFSERKSEMLDEILKDNNGDKYYYLMENYAQKKIRRLILNNDYDFAKETTLVVIDNNLDNVDAVEMYSLIIDSYEIQKETERKRAIALQEEAERIEKAKEKARPSAEKTYVGSSTADGKNVYLSAEKDMNFTRYEWKAQLGIADLALFSGKHNGLLYGINLNAAYNYSFVNYTLGVDASFGANFAGDSDITIDIPFEFSPKIALTQISRKLFFKAGLAGEIATISTENKIESRKDNFLSPALGLSFEKVKIGPTELGFGFDYYPWNVIGEKYLLAGGVNASIDIPLKETEKVKLLMTLGIKDKFILQNSGNLDNRIHVILAVGGKNVIR